MSDERDSAEPPPTEPIVELELEPTEPIVVIEPTEPIVVLEPTEPMEVVDQAGAPVGDAATELLREPEQGGALNELFGSDSFQEYHEPLIPTAPRARGASSRAPLARSQKTLFWVAGSLIALLAVVAIFFGGTRIPLLLGPAPGAGPMPSLTASPTPTPTPTERPSGPVEPGDYAWDSLGGGECLEPFVDAWQEEYTVVDCAEPHSAQLVSRAPFALAEGATEPGPYPGEGVLAAQMSLLCSAPEAIDLTAAGAFSDLQVQGAYAVTPEAWQAGENEYFCFVSRSSGEPLTGSLAAVTP